MNKKPDLLTRAFGHVSKNILFNYENSDYVTRQKAHILFWVSIAGILIFGVSLVIQITSKFTNNEMIYLVNLGFIASILISITLLFLGRYRIAALFLLFFVIISWGFGFYMKIDDYLVTGHNSYLFLIFPIIVLESLLGNKIVLSILAVFFVIVNLVILKISLAESNLFAQGEIFRNTLDIVISISFIFALTYLYSLITERALIFANEELELNRDLNKHLEDKVNTRTEEIEAAYVELEAMNHNLINVNEDLEKAHRIIRNDLKMAQNVQSRFFKSEPPKNKNYDAAFHYQPLSGVSGDIYDFYVFKDVLEGVTLCDVSGHGVSSGLLTVLAKSILFRSFSDKRKKPLNEIITSANEILINELEKTRNYLTGVFLKLNDKKVEYVNAAHPDIIKRNSKEKKCEVIKKYNNSNKGFFLGMKGFGAPYTKLIFEMQKNDSLLLFSDALIETMDADRQQFGQDRLIKSFENCSDDMSSEEILKSILHDFYYDTNGKLRDDLTIVVLKKK